MWNIFEMGEAQNFATRIFSAVSKFISDSAQEFKFILSTCMEDRTLKIVMDA